MMWTYETVKSLEGKGCGCPPQHLPVLEIIFDFDSFAYVAGPAFWGVTSRSFARTLDLTTPNGSEWSGSGSEWVRTFEPHQYTCQAPYSQYHANSANALVKILTRGSRNPTCCQPL